jgi:hypothetical protein
MLSVNRHNLIATAIAIRLQELKFEPTVSKAQMHVASTEELSQVCDLCAIGPKETRCGAGL